MISIVIPSRNEIYLNKTLEDLLLKAKGDIEIVVALDGYWPSPIIADDRIVYVHHGKSQGMRASINSAVAVAKGPYILKCDAHCMFDEGYDVKLAANCERNWVVVPRRKRLDAESWAIKDVGKPDVDYEYLSFPNSDASRKGDWGGLGLHGRQWNERAVARRDILVDDNMSAQGSCWFMFRNYFYELELEDEENYGTFNHEFQEIGLKAWLSGGKVVTNKKTYYCHLHKGKEMGRGYTLDDRQLDKGTAYANKWLTNSAWKKQKLPFNWLIEKFWPVPEWPENYKEIEWEKLLGQ